jgi:hypothetical protein
VTFGAPVRNTVQYNLRSGIKLTGGSNRVMATDVANTVFDGIVVSGGTQRIGYEGATVAGGRVTAKDLALATSNAIYSSGGFGINVTNNAAVATTTIEGNYLGTNATGTSALINRRGNIFLTIGAISTPVVTTPSFSLTNYTGTDTTIVKILTITFADPHGLTTDRKVFLNRVTPTGGSAQDLKLPVTVKFLTDRTVEVALTQADFNTLQGKIGAANTGLFTIEFYGPSTGLSQVGNRDFEGNQHGLDTTRTGGSDNPRGGVLNGRPTIAFPRRR